MKGNWNFQKQVNLDDGMDSTLQVESISLLRTMRRKIGRNLSEAVSNPIL